MNVKVPNISAAFPLNPTLSPDCGGEGENLGHLWTLPATVCSIQRTG